MDILESQEYSNVVLKNVKDMQSKLDALSKHIYSKMDDISVKIEELDKAISKMEADMETPIDAADSGHVLASEE
ncbi:hypothetical protein K493DRAFT_314966 [Basidiobolus meristosporus CBS 931.73]|uniref:Uncharacterized protein n=1 Tax=Basidiobolus meristosporus CBS 931.73 TaxID=1314790 RepID=A0A1Y1YC18_9FUNG|nr:hypothetical protein K493DRAFT_314966 [Basidiobolus meristosporus CBS 931.73]|eukprot:ORX95483.1 hypothetical protein K493DRAFT_314966 [Basidiobolus meristosporus CBS 931.73]